MFHTGCLIFYKRRIVSGDVLDLLFIFLKGSQRDPFKKINGVFEGENGEWRITGIVEVGGDRLG